MSEQVLCLRAEVVASAGLSTGFTPYSDKIWDHLMHPDNFNYLSRATVETDLNFKQVIPYMVLRHEGKLFHFNRAGSESRLHGKECIGIGGHINVTDTLHGPFDIPYLNGAKRELDEEVDLVGGYESDTIGFLNYDWDEVGKVHLGVAHLIELTSPCRPREETKGGCFTPQDELFLRQEEFERWSQFTLRYLNSLKEQGK